MDSNSIDELISVITLNTEIDEDTARSCILNELALVDDLYKKEFFNELSSTIYKGIGSNVKNVEDIVKASQDIQEKGDFITVAKAKADKEAEEMRKKADNEAYVAEFVQYKEELDAKETEINDNKKFDVFKNYKNDIEDIYGYTAEDLEETTSWLRGLFGDEFNRLSEDEQQQMAADYRQGKTIYETVKKVAEEQGIPIEDAHVDVAIGELISGCMDHYCSVIETDEKAAKIAYNLLIELYQKLGKSEDELSKDLSEMKDGYQVGGKAGQIGRESKLQEVRAYISKYSDGSTVDEIIEEKVILDMGKVATHARLTEFERFKEEIENNPNMTQKEKKAAIDEKAQSYLIDYTSNFSIIVGLYGSQVKALRKSLRESKDENEKEEIQRKIDSIHGKTEKLFDIKPTHRITMIYDLDKKVASQIDSYKEALEKTTDEAERKRLTAIIGKLEANRLNLKNDVRYEAIFGKAIEKQLKQVLMSKRKEIDAKIENAAKELAEAKKRNEEIKQRGDATEEEKQDSEREVRKQEIVLYRYQKDKERYQNDSVDEAFTDAEIFQIRRSYKKNQIKESIRESKTQVSEIVSELKKLDPNSKEYIETVSRIKDIKRDLRVRLMEFGENKDDVNAVLNSYAFVSSKEILDVMYAESLNNVRTISTSGILIEQQGHSEGKESLCRIDECRKFADYFSKKLCETTDPSLGLEGVIARHDVFFDALTKADFTGKKDSFEAVINEMNATDEEKKEYAEILEGYLADEPDPEKRRLIIKRLSYAPNIIPLRRTVKYGIETEKEKSQKKIKDAELDEYFEQSKENIIVNEIIITGTVDQVRDTFAEEHIQEEPQPVPLGEEQASIKPTPVQNNSVLAGITAGTKESERIAAESEYSKLNPEATKEDKSQEDKKSENEETK